LLSKQLPEACETQCEHKGMSRQAERQTEREKNSERSKKREGTCGWNVCTKRETWYMHADGRKECSTERAEHMQRGSRPCEAVHMGYRDKHAAQKEMSETEIHRG
jgi:hypothetical protein